MKTKDKVMLAVLPFAAMAAVVLLALCGVVTYDVLVGMMSEVGAAALATLAVAVGVIVTGVYAMNRNDEGWK